MVSLPRGDIHWIQLSVAGVCVSESKELSPNRNIFFWEVVADNFFDCTPNCSGVGQLLSGRAQPVAVRDCRKGSTFSQSSHRAALWPLLLVPWEDKQISHIIGKDTRETFSLKDCSSQEQVRAL